MERAEPVAVAAFSGEQRAGPNEVTGDHRPIAEADKDPAQLPAADRLLGRTAEAAQQRVPGGDRRCVVDLPV